MTSLKNGLLYHAQFVKAVIAPTIFASNQLINYYGNNGLLREARKLFDEMSERNVFSWNAIISANIKAGELENARALFNTAPFRDLVTYNSMLAGYVSCNGCEASALELFVEMQNVVRVDEFSFTTMLNLIAKLSVVSIGRQLHSSMVKTGNDLSSFAFSSLIDMYSKCGSFEDVCKVFNGRSGVIDVVSKNATVAACCREGNLDMAFNIFWSEPEINDIISWNTLISGFEQNGFEEESLKLFLHMGQTKFKWNEHTFASVLSACSSLRNLKLGKEVHTWILKKNLNWNPFISSGLVDVYCKCGNMRYAKSVHAQIETENSYSISSMIVGYSSQGNMAEALKLFDSLADKNSVVWTALFSGYVKLQQCETVFELFSEFRTNEASTPDALMLICVISACAIQAALAFGKQIHAYVLRVGIEMDKKLVSALVDMYSKCGNIAYPERIFRRFTECDLVLYNVMIAGYAHHGHENEAIQLFEEMVGKGMKPDVITFVALLSACRHSGSVELGEQLFYLMSERYNLIPETDHYACMIDLYGRKNQLEKAVAFMRKIPIDLDTVIWGAFLNACRINGKADLARMAEKKLLNTEGEVGARYVQLANAYAADGNWEEMGRMRRKMRGKEVKKMAGCSWLFVENNVDVFISGDVYHSKTEAIYSTLACLNDELSQISKTPCQES